MDEEGDGKEPEWLTEFKRKEPEAMNKLNDTYDDLMMRQSETMGEEDDERLVRLVEEGRRRASERSEGEEKVLISGLFARCWLRAEFVLDACLVWMTGDDFDWCLGERDVNESTIMYYTRNTVQTPRQLWFHLACRFVTKVGLILFVFCFFMFLHGIPVCMGVHPDSNSEERKRRREERRKSRTRFQTHKWRRFLDSVVDFCDSRRYAFALWFFCGCFIFVGFFDEED